MPYCLSQFFYKHRLLGLLFFFFFYRESPAQMQKLKVADNYRFLVKEDDTPFVWIGETNWFFAKLPPATIDSILNKRQQQGFTIMFVSCREELYNGGGPGNINHPNENWWAYLDEYIQKCKKRNMYVGLTLGWYHILMKYSEEELYKFGMWVGDRYKDQNNIVWLTLGEAGSHARKKTIPDTKLEALVKGIRKGDTGNKLLTVHADFRRGTSISNDAELSDFNNWQTSQWCCRNDLPRKDDRQWTVWEAITYDYSQRYQGRPKPTLDAEAFYENNKDFCGTSPFIIRRRAYFTMLAGAFGHTYGAGGIWDGLQEGEKCSGSALEAVHYVGAEHMGYVSSFFHKLKEDFLKLRPDQSLIRKGNSRNYDLHIQAAKAIDNSFAIIYSASDNPYGLDVSKLNSSATAGLWYNPRNNTIEPIESSFSNSIEDSLLIFDPPGEEGSGNDWILLIGNRDFIKRFD